jgi:hypothetical protein
LYCQFNEKISIMIQQVYNYTEAIKAIKRAILQNLTAIEIKITRKDYALRKLESCVLI